MADIGIMLYGYGEEDAQLIHRTLEEALEQEVELISAAGQEERVVTEILDRADSVNFEDREVKVLMMLGFSEDQLETTLREFPKVEGLPRPIFCTLTQHNARWPLLHLIEDLQQERRAFQEMRRQLEEQSLLPSNMMLTPNAMAQAEAASKAEMDRFMKYAMMNGQLGVTYKMDDDDNGNKT